MFYFLRHGETDFNQQRLWMGQTDISLNKNGIEQAIRASKELSTIKFKKIYTSPLIRAYETAKIVLMSQLESPDFLVIDDLKERGFGKLEGQKKAFSSSELSNLINGIFFEIEKEEFFISRVQSAMLKIIEDSPTLVVSHSGIYNCLTKKISYLPCNHIEHIRNGQFIEMRKSK